ncbi:hypothetical protein EI969_12150 [Pseudomonas sp. PB101]|uniref:Rap1a/Tai family immunity protein n=1 Tax=Pseudomonas sp. PB101 TaxID=2495428 RepID=UPI001365540D|nr:Rap1a/Tai family immunity protein [Pseudomonas sp. PB101]MVW86677.1 hypothetical protein [Pseudomonas sp. PB101]
MKAWILFVMAVSATLSSNRGFADVTDGNALLKQCDAAVKYLDEKSPKASIADAMYCFGLVTGVMNTLATYGRQLPKAEGTCFPSEGISTSQAVRIVAKSIRDAPESLHLPGSVLAIVAFNQAYPCK